MYCNGLITLSFNKSIRKAASVTFANTFRLFENTSKSDQVKIRQWLFHEDNLSKLFAI